MSLFELFAFEYLYVWQPQRFHKICWAHETSILSKEEAFYQMLHYKYEIKVLSCKYHMEGKHGFRKIGIIFENNDVKVEYDNGNFI